MCRPESPFCLQRPDALTGAEFVQIDSVVKEPAGVTRHYGRDRDPGRVARPPFGSFGTPSLRPVTPLDLTRGAFPSATFWSADCGSQGDSLYPFADTRYGQIARTPSDNAPLRAWKGKRPREACSLHVSQVTVRPPPCWRSRAWMSEIYGGGSRSPRR